MITKFTLLATAALLMGSGVVFAQESEEKAPPPEAQARHAEMMKEIDTDGDGAVSSAESAARAEKMFEEIDTDKDGAVTPEEMQAHHKADKERHMMEKRKRMMEKSDPDGDGKISKDEFLKNAAERNARLDSDGDGKVTKDEAKAARKEKGEKMKALREKRDGEGRRERPDASGGAVE